MSDDIDEKDQEKVLDYLNDRSLKEHPLANHTANEIANGTGLDVSKVNVIGNDLIGRNWVDVDHYADAGEWTIRINSIGKIARDELKSGKNSQNISDNKIIAGGDVNINVGTNNKIKSKEPYSKNKTRSKTKLILLIVGTISTLILVGYVVYDHLYSKETNAQQPQTNIMTNPNGCQDSDSGKIYQNCQLDFQISRPNLDWSFNKDVRSEITGLGNDNGFLGGIIVSSPNDDNVGVLVFKDNSTALQLLNNELLEITNGYHLKPPMRLDKNSYSFQIIGKNNNSTLFFKDKFEQHGNKIFLIQVIAHSPFSSIPDEIMISLDQVYNSFDNAKS